MEESGLSKPIKASELRFKRGVQDWRRCVASCSEFAVCYFDPDGLRKLIRSIATTRASVQKKKKILRADHSKLDVNSLSRVYIDIYVTHTLNWTPEHEIASESKS